MVMIHSMISWCSPCSSAKEWQRSLSFSCPNELYLDDQDKGIRSKEGRGKEKEYAIQLWMNLMMIQWMKRSSFRNDDDDDGYEEDGKIGCLGWKEVLDGIEYHHCNMIDAVEFLFLFLCLHFFHLTLGKQYEIDQNIFLSYFSRRRVLVLVWNVCDQLYRQDWETERKIVRDTWYDHKSWKE